MNILVIAVAVIGSLMGIITTLYLCISLPAIIIWKIYRKIRFQIPLTK